MQRDPSKDHPQEHHPLCVSVRDRMIDRLIGIAQLIVFGFVVAGGFTLLGVAASWLQASR